MPDRTDSEVYSLGDAQSQSSYVSGRWADRWVGFLLPHLQAGFSVLDCGCGTGSITLDLAEIVAPGQVVGVDADATQLEAARAGARQRGLSNVAFEEGNAYSLRFADGSFDAVLAHTLLYHLSDPMRALREFHRVLKPGGVVGVSDDDLGTVVYSPELPSLRRGFDVWRRFVQHNGGNPFSARHLRRHLLDAGFERVAGQAAAPESDGTPAETHRFAAVAGGLFQSPALVETAVREGWATRDEMQAVAADLAAWGEQPDAFYARGRGVIPSWLLRHCPGLLFPPRPVPPSHDVFKQGVRSGEGVGA